MVDLKDRTRSRCYHCDEPVVFYKRKEVPLPEPNHRGETTRIILRRWFHEVSGEEQCAPNPDQRWRTRADPIDYCTEHTQGDRWSKGEVCHRKVTNEKYKLCGIHARPKIEKEAKRAAYERKASEEAVIREGVNEAIEELKTYGLECRMHSSYIRNGDEYGGGTYKISGDIVLDPHQLLELLESMQEDFT